MKSTIRAMGVNRVEITYKWVRKLSKTYLLKGDA